MLAWMRSTLLQQNCSKQVQRPRVGCHLRTARLSLPCLITSHQLAVRAVLVLVLVWVRVRVLVLVLVLVGRLDEVAHQSRELV